MLLHHMRPKTSGMRMLFALHAAADQQHENAVYITHGRGLQPCENVL